MLDLLNPEKATGKTPGNEIKDITAEYLNGFPIDRDFNRLLLNGANLGNTGQIPNELESQTERYHIAKLHEQRIEPFRKAYLTEAAEAEAKISEARQGVSVREKQRHDVLPKIERKIPPNIEEKIPWEKHQIVLCWIIGSVALGLSVWACINVRNMAVNSMPVFAAFPNFAFGIGGVILGIACVLEITPDIIGSGKKFIKIYHSVLISTTAAAALIWIVLFAKSAGLLGQDGTMHNISDFLKPADSFLGLSPESMDTVYTISQLMLEFLIPSLCFIYIYRQLKVHGSPQPQMIIEDNPVYVKLTEEIGTGYQRVSALQEKIQAPEHFERLVPHIRERYIGEAKADIRAMYQKRRQNIFLGIEVNT